MWCKFYLAVLGMMLLANNATAEDVTFNYEQAVERALTLDPRISEREKLVDVARGMLDEAKNSASWMYDFNAFLGVAPSIRGGFFEGADGRFDPNSLDFEGVGPWYNLEFTVVRPLHTYGKIEHYSTAAKNNISIKEGDVKLERAQVYLDVTRAYYGYLAAVDGKYLLEDALDKLSGALSLAERWAEEGEGKQSDVFALQTGIGLVQRYSAELVGMERIAMAALKMLLGVKAEDSLKLADSRLEPLDLPEMTLAGLQQKALTHRPEMGQVEAGLKARRALVAAKNSEAYPNVYAGIGGSFAYSPERVQTTDVAVYDPFNHAGLTPVLGLKWDWNSGAQQAQVKQAQAELDALVEKKSFALQGIPFQVAEAFHTVQAKHEMVQQLYKAARSGRRWMITTYADFEAGVEEASEVMTALQAYILAYGDYIRVVNDYNLSVAQLKVVTGEKP
ncbi:MAG: TolC family protein [Gammaproteobacteria bacterium]|jgi:outer membrane protein TolC